MLAEPVGRRTGPAVAIIASMLALTLSTLLLASAAGAAQEPPAVLSAAAADSFDQKLRALLARARQPLDERAERIAVTEAEVNSYLGLRLLPRLPPGVSGLTVRLGKGVLEARALVDVDQVRARLEGGAWAPLSLLTGNVAVELASRIISDDGFARLEVQEVWVGSMPVPTSAVERLVAAWTRTAQNPEGFDILSPFRLPYSVKRVRVRPGLASLEF